MNASQGNKAEGVVKGPASHLTAGRGSSPSWECDEGNQIGSSVGLLSVLVLRKSCSLNFVQSPVNDCLLLSVRGDAATLPAGRAHHTTPGALSGSRAGSHPGPKWLQGEAGHLDSGVPCAGRRKTLTWLEFLSCVRGPGVGGALGFFAQEWDSRGRSWM